MWIDLSQQGGEWPTVEASQWQRRLEEGDQWRQARPATADGDLGVGEVRDVGGALGEANPGVHLAGGGRSTTGCPRRRKAGDAELRRVRQSSICLGGDSGLTGWLLRVLRCVGTTVTLGTAPGRGAQRAEANEWGGDGESSFLCPAGDKVVSLSGARDRGGVKCGLRSETVGVAGRIKGGVSALALAVDRVAMGQFQIGVSSARYC
jgi:hypothetical protein